MGYRELFQEENELVEERYALIMERIHAIAQEDTVDAPYGDFFQKNTAFLMMIEELLQLEKNGALEQRTLQECETWNQRLYQDITPQNYMESYTNPAYAESVFGKEYGQILCFLAAELRAMIPYAYEGRVYDITILCELFVEIYNHFEEKIIDRKEIKDSICSFYHDYSEVFAEKRIREQLNPEYDFFTKIVMESDLENPCYLYRYGEYITENERKMAEFLNRMPQEEIQAMADTFTEGYRIGFEVTRKDLSKKNTVNIRYPIGFERMVRAAIHNFSKMGLKPTIVRGAYTSFFGRMNKKNGCCSQDCNPQFEYDHKDDQALYLDKAFVERHLEATRAAYEKYKEYAAKFGGPAVIEVFGEKPFAPERKKQALQFDEKQQKLKVYYANEAGSIVNQYIPGEEYSFTIIAYPLPEIGPKFEEIFAKTVELNTLDYKKYQTMQQKIIDVLDTAQQVRVQGAGQNKTDICVQLHPLKNPAKETIFENCVADVNIPVGEVFTSPKLEGTNGTLHVTKVYLNGLQFQNLELQIKDGKIADYTCTNFEKEDENRNYIQEQILFHHDTLPLGEFAIGTNTTAYRMARDYQIADKLPILIAEKTGPHFAVGDTCYSHAEDTAVYNPDGKEIIARDNEVSLLRKEDPSKAYFNCHTDITIPYDELKAITVIRADGSTQDIIRDGKFVVPGCEELNLPLEMEEKEV